MPGGMHGRSNAARLSPRAARAGARSGRQRLQWIRFERAISDTLIIETWRGFLLYVLLFGAMGLLAELYLLDHHEDWRQWIPLALLACGAVAGGWLAMRPSRRAVRTFRFLLASCIPAGLLGVWFHFQSNLEFERELHPNSSGLELAGASLGGAMPTLAPGAMILLGLLGILVAHQHPADRRALRWPDLPASQDPAGRPP